MSDDQINSPPHLTDVSIGDYVRHIPVEPRPPLCGTIVNLDSERADVLWDNGLASTGVPLSELSKEKPNATKTECEHAT